ncbi:hypothetical protein HK097_001294 [Rhizophlyctis rosea]|uniref:Uncharacterized protein n=1 Tax=Rhizophlyctis rosea TaxID=64517 RepID=A0AAD5WZ03_9FUNG|nr:hypothetical protein HK097_001294 [Rhizophlyctis rosea]
MSALLSRHNPFQVLPDEVLKCIFIDLVGKHSIKSQSTRDFLNLLLVDKFTKSVILPVKEGLAQAQIMYLQGMIVAYSNCGVRYHIVDPKSHARLLKNPLFDAHQSAYYFLEAAETDVEMLRLVTPILSAIPYTYSPKKPIPLQNDAVVAFANEYCYCHGATLPMRVAGRSEDKAICVLKDPVVVTVGPVTAEDKGLIDTEKWDYAVLLPELDRGKKFVALVNATICTFV